MPIEQSRIGSWHENARCRGVAVEVFFLGGSLSSKEPALALCAQCNVRAECLEDAYATEDPVNTYGIRAGLTSEQRMRLWHRRRFNPNIVPDSEWANIEARYRRAGVAIISSVDRRKKKRNHSTDRHQRLKEAILSGRLHIFDQLRTWKSP